MTPRPRLVDQLAAAADGLRGRLLLALDGRELTVGEFCEVVQLPQSTVSRHLKTLLDSGWVSSRREGTNRFYGVASDDLSPAARRVWNVLREDLAATPAAEQDDRRLKGVLAERRTTSEEFFSSAAGQWDRLREETVRAHQPPPRCSRRCSTASGSSATWAAERARWPRPSRRSSGASWRSTRPARCCTRRAPDCAGSRNVELRKGTLERLPLDDALARCGGRRAGAAPRARSGAGLCRGRARAQARRPFRRLPTCCRTSTTTTGRRWGTCGSGSSPSRWSGLLSSAGFDARARERADHRGRRARARRCSWRRRVQPAARRASGR